MMWFTGPINTVKETVLNKDLCDHFSEIFIYVNIKYMFKTAIVKIILLEKDF